METLDITWKTFKVTWKWILLLCLLSLLFPPTWPFWMGAVGVAWTACKVLFVLIIFIIASGVIIGICGVAIWLLLKIVSEVWNFTNT